MTERINLWFQLEFPSGRKATYAESELNQHEMTYSERVERTYYNRKRKTILVQLRTSPYDDNNLGTYAPFDDPDTKIELEYTNWYPALPPGGIKGAYAETIASLYTNQLFPDFTLKVDGGTTRRIFRVHKAILSSVSDYFNDLFSETIGNKLSIKYDPDIVDAILRCIYHDVVPLIGTQGLKIMNAAKYFGLRIGDVNQIDAITYNIRKQPTDDLAEYLEEFVKLYPDGVLIELGRLTEIEKDVRRFLKTGDEEVLVRYGNAVDLKLAHVIGYGYEDEYRAEKKARKAARGGISSDEDGSEDYSGSSEV